MAWAIWITGLPGCGKSTVAQGVAARGGNIRVLELDAIRRVVTPEPTYSEEERGVLYRCLAVMAALLVEAGTNVIVDATANRQAYRDLARCLIPRFAEVYLRCPVEICRERERHRFGGYAPQRIYEQADRLRAPVPGVGAPYEPPEAPELIIDVGAVTVGDAVERVVALTETLDPRGSEAAGVPYSARAAA